MPETKPSTLCFRLVIAMEVLNVSLILPSMLCRLRCCGENTIFCCSHGQLTVPSTPTGLRESSPTLILEAMSFGRIIIISETLCQRSTVFSLGGVILQTMLSHLRRHPMMNLPMVSLVRLPIIISSSTLWIHPGLSTFRLLLLINQSPWLRSRSFRAEVA
jgi:hypothetical protein